MLYSTNGQILVFLAFFAYGILCFLGITIYNYLYKKAKKIKNNKILQNFLDCIIYSTFGLLFITLNNNINYGEFRLYVLFAFIFGIISSFYLNKIIKNKIKQNKSE